MVLPIVALVLAVPQLLGYAVTRLAPRAGVPEWLAAAVAAYTAIWYPSMGALLSPPASQSFHGGIAPLLAWGALVVGLCYQLVVGGVLATAVVRRRRRASP
jgi:hypothetical protein